MLRKKILKTIKIKKHFIAYLIDGFVPLFFFKHQVKKMSNKDKQAS